MANRRLISIDLDGDTLPERVLDALDNIFISTLDLDEELALKADTSTTVTSVNGVLPVGGNVALPWAAPVGGILESELSSALQTKVNEVKKPTGGWLKTDLVSTVQTSLSKADTAVQPSGLTAYALKASPALTGTPTAPTATTLTKTTQLATTAFVHNVVDVIELTPGPQGEIGPQGPQGLVGPQGLQGIQGLIGPEGPIGPQGIQGDKGDKGDTGDGLELSGAVDVYSALPASAPIGSTWMVSSEGRLYTRTASGWPAEGTGGLIQGPQGLQGIQGIQGPIGPEGPRGLTGLQGIQGVKGDKGDKGDTGLQGIQGVQGLKGDTGNQGIQGNPGVKGDRGEPGLLWRGVYSAATAYAANDAVTNGGNSYRAKVASTGQVLTNANYWELIAAKGAQGDQGIQGPQGIQGLKGDTGATGPAGSTTISGITGLQTELDKKAATEWVVSRGTNLVTNGTGYLGNSTNFTGFLYDSSDTPPGIRGSFVSGGLGTTATLSEYIPINSANRYTIKYWARQRVLGGATVKHYMALVPYDSYGGTISPYMYMRQPGTTTTLAADLKPGDTQVQLTSAANWYNGSATHMRTLVFWNYVDQGGKVWPSETYSRNYSSDVYDAGAVNTATNTITLRTPWAKELVTAGTSLSNGSSGGNYIYPVAAVAVPEEWTQFQASMEAGVNMTGSASTASNGWPPGTGMVRLSFLMNYGVATQGVSKHAIAGVEFYPAPVASELKSGSVSVDKLDSSVQDKLAQIVSMSEAEAIAGTSSIGRLISAGRLRDVFRSWSTGSMTTAITATGQSLNKATSAADARSIIGAGTPVLYEDTDGVPYIDFTSTAPVGASFTTTSDARSLAQDEITKWKSTVGDSTYGLVDTVRIIDTHFASLNDAITATPVGGVLEVRKSWTRTLPLLVDKAITLEFHGGGITQTTDSDVIVLQSSSIQLNSPVVTGPGATTNGIGRGIVARGTVSAPLIGLRIRAPRIRGIRHTAIELEHAHGHVVEDLDIAEIGYAGVIALSCDGGTVRGGSIRSILQSGSLVNSYGVAYTRNSSKTLADAPHSTGFTVQDLTVDGVSGWEGIDTHAGRGGKILNCTIKNTKYPVRIVGCPNNGGDGGPAEWAPHDVLVMGCIIDNTGMMSGSGSAITFTGAFVGGMLIEQASGCAAINNTIVRCGDPTIPSTGAVFIYATIGFVVMGNTIKECTARGVYIDHNNTGVVVVGNHFIDIWQESGSASAINLLGANNSATIMGNRGSRGSKVAPIVNERGIWNNSASNSLTLGQNDFETFSLPLVDTFNSSANRSWAKKTGFYGVNPVTRPVVTGSRAGEPASMASLRSALASLGLITDSTTA